MIVLRMLIGSIPKLKSQSTYHSFKLKISLFKDGASPPSAVSKRSFYSQKIKVNKDINSRVAQN